MRISSSNLIASAPVSVEATLARAATTFKRCDKQCWIVFDTNSEISAGGTPQAWSALHSTESRRAAAIATSQLPRLRECPTLAANCLKWNTAGNLTPALVHASTASMYEPSENLPTLLTKLNRSNRTVHTPEAVLSPFSSSWPH